MFEETHANSPTGSVLVLDDERNIVTVLKAILEKRNFTVEGFTDPREALDALRSHKFDAAVTDLYMPDIDGMAFLEESKRLYPGLPVVMITAFGTVDSAVDAIKRGAFDYVTKPFEQSEIVSVLQKAVNTSRLKNHSVERAPAIPELATSALLGGNSSTMKQVREIVKRVAPTPSTVLILGETGTGKELIARAIHNLSNRNSRRMVKMNCAAMPAGLLESDLFGHERGAFTGASSQRLGRFDLVPEQTDFLPQGRGLGAAVIKAVRRIRCFIPPIAHPFGAARQCVVDLDPFRFRKRESPGAL